LKHLIDNTDSDSDSSSDDGSDTHSLLKTIRSKDEIIRLSAAFADIEKDSQAHHSIASVLLYHNHSGMAFREAQSALEMCDDTSMKLRIKDLIANIQLKLGQKHEAYNTIKECLSAENVGEPIYVRSALVTQAKIEKELEMWDAALASYREARLTDAPDLTSGRILEEETQIFVQTEDHAAFLALIKSWKPAETLNWMTWDYENSALARHSQLQRSAALAGAQDFMVKAYEEAIRSLDTVDSGAPLRVDLAEAHWRVRGDIDAAKELLNEVLDSRAPRWEYLFTAQEPSETLSVTMDMMADILFERFRDTADPDAKAAVLAEMESLMQRTLVQSVSLPNTYLVHYYVSNSPTLQLVSSGYL
jgi:tetratricopeptide (TPR) repeat protein